MGVTVAVTRVAANTSTGNQTISTADLGGLTPKAVLLLASRNTTDGTAIDGAGWYVGAGDGTNEWNYGYESQHAQATMDVEWIQNTTANRILTIYDGTADNVVDAVADFVSFQADGVTINWTNAPAGAYLIEAIFFAGSDLTANVGYADLGNTADALVDITTVGFEADVLITSMPKGASAQGPGFSFGFVHNNRSGTVTQRCITHSQRSTFGTSQTGVQYRDGECIAKLILSSQALDWAGAATSFDSSGFSVQLSGGRSPNNTPISWIALRLGTTPVISAKVYTYSTPTATGSHTDSNPGFTPQAVFYLPNRAAAADTSETDADGGTVGFLAVDADDLYTYSTGDEDAAADSNTQSLSDDILNLPTHTGTTGHQATLTSLGSTGPVWNYSATDGTARLWPALAFGTSGTQFTQDVSGGITPTGAIFKDGRKVLSGGSTPAGALSKSTNKTLAGDLSSIVGTLTKSAQKILSGDISSIVGTLVTSRIVLKILEGTMTLAGTLVNQANKILGGTLTSDGSINKASTKDFSGAVTPSGEISKQANKAFDGTVTPSGTLSQIIGKFLSGEITPAGLLAKLTSKTFTGDLTPSGNVAKQDNKSFTGDIAPTGTITKQTNKPLDGTVTSSGSLLKQTLKFLSGILTLAGDLTADFIGGAGDLFFQSISGGITPSGDLSKSTGKNLSGDLTPSGNVNKFSSVSVSGVLTSAGSVIKMTSNFLAGILSSVGTLTKRTDKNLEGELSSTGSLTTTNVFVKMLEGGLAFVGTITKSVSKQLSGNITPTGIINKTVSKILSGILSLAGQLATLFGVVPSTNIIYLEGDIVNTVELDAEKVSAEYLRGNVVDTIEILGSK